MSRAGRGESRLTVPLTLLVVPVLILQGSHVPEPWRAIAGVLDWAIWRTFVAEVAIMLAVVEERRAWLARHPLRCSLELRFTGPELAELLGLPPSTISAVLTRCAMGKLGRLGLAAAERSDPSELLDVDMDRLAGPVALVGAAPARASGAAHRTPTARSPTRRASAATLSAGTAVTRRRLGGLCTADCASESQRLSRMVFARGGSQEPRPNRVATFQSDPREARRWLYLGVLACAKRRRTKQFSALRRADAPRA